MIRRRLAVVGILVSLAVSASCSGRDEQAAMPSWLLELNPAFGQGFGDVPESQVAVLRDGDLTFAEFEAATLASIQCMSAASFPPVGEVTYDEAAHRFDYRLNGGTTAESAARASQVMSDCIDEHVVLLGTLWMELHKPGESERQAVALATSDCLRELGVSAFPDPNRPQFQQWALNQPDPGPGSYATEIAVCFDRILDEYGFLPGQY